MRTWCSRLNKQSLPSKCGQEILQKFTFSPIHCFDVNMTPIPLIEIESFLRAHLLNIFELPSQPLQLLVIGNANFRWNLSSRSLTF